MLRTSRRQTVNSSGGANDDAAATPPAAQPPKKTKTTKTKVSRRSDVTPIFGGVATIFRTTHSGDVYQFQMWVSEENKYVRRSLKTRDKELAIKRGQEEFIRYKAKIQNGEKIFSLLASEMRDKYLEYTKGRVKTKQISAGRESNIKTYTKHWLEFVGEDMRVQDIDRRKYIDYLGFRQEQFKGISTTVVNNESITIKQMYKWAIDCGYVTQKHFPDFGEFKTKKHEVRRESFSVGDYVHLTEVAKLWYAKVQNGTNKYDEQVYYRRSVRDFIILMARFGFRTGELLNTRWRDVIIHDDGIFATVRIPAENTKVRIERTVTGRRGDVFARRLEYSQHTKPDDFVFSHFSLKDANGRAIAKKPMRDALYEYYNDLKKVVKAKHPDFDETKDLYSLRHFWITMQLQVAKVDIHKIARYAGTSIIQIQRHYDSVKDKQISEQINAYKIKFDEKNNDFLLDE
jgi:integrase